MTLTTRQAGFLIIFLLSWLILLLLGESYLNFLLFGLVIVSWWLFRSQLDWSRFFQRSKLMLVWLGFLILAVISTFFSESLPLAIDQLANYFFISYLFWFIYLLKSDFMETQNLLKAILLLASTLIFLSALFKFFPAWGQLLPSMNLLYATYGHNHLAALMLLLIPLSWWLAFSQLSAELNLSQDQQNKWSWLWLLLPILFNLALWTSFGRVAITIGFLQLIFLWWELVNHGDKINKKWPKLRLIFPLIATIFVLVIFVKAFFSVAAIFDPDFICPFPRFKVQLCKSVLAEPRPEYWRLAFDVIKDKPFLGAGPGNFKIASHRYHPTPDLSASYAHNAYLQFLAELGWLGGSVFIGLMIHLFYEAYRAVDWRGKQKEIISWKKAIFYGLAAIYSNVFFDFDWSFVGLLGLTLIFMALLLRANDSNKAAKKSLRNVIIPKIILNGWAALVVLLAIIYLGVEILIQTNNTAQAFNTFPYFHWHQRIYQQAESLNNSQKERFLRIYQAHPEVYFYSLTWTEDPSQKQQLKEKWVEIDPWQLVNQDLTSYLIETKQLVKAESYLTQALDFMKKIENQGEYKFSYHDKNKFADKFLSLGDAYYREGKMEQAARLYRQSLEFNTWGLDSHRPVFLDLPITAQSVKFFSELNEINPDYFGKYRQSYARYYGKSLSAELEETESSTLNELNTHLTRILAIAGGERWEVWQEVASLLLDQAENEIQQNKFQASYEKLNSLVQGQAILSEDETVSLVWEIRERLANDLITVSQPLLQIKPQQALQARQQAQELLPWILDNQPHWLEQLELEQLSLALLEEYFEILETASAEEISWQTERRTKLVVALIKRLIKMDELETALEYGYQSQDISYPADEIELELVVWLQQQAREAAQASNWQRAEKITELMVVFAPFNYWVNLQPANLQLAQNKIVEAEALYRICLKRYEMETGQIHEACQLALDSLQLEQSPPADYFEIARLVENNL